MYPLEANSTFMDIKINKQDQYYKLANYKPIY